MTVSHLSVAFLPSAVLPFARPTTFRNAVRTLPPHRHARLPVVRTTAPPHLNPLTDPRTTPPSALSLDFSRSDPAPSDFNSFSPVELTPDPSIGFVPSDDDPDDEAVIGSLGADAGPDIPVNSESDLEDDEAGPDIESPFITDIPPAAQRASSSDDANPIEEILDDSEPAEEGILAQVGLEDPSESLMVVADDADADVLASDDDDDDDIDDDDFEQAETDEDIQSAADILSDRGLLGLGVEKTPRKDASSLSKFALMDDDEDDDDDDEVDDEVEGDIVEAVDGDIEDEDEDDDEAAAIADAAEEDEENVEEEGAGDSQQNIVLDDDDDEEEEEEEEEDEDDTDIAISDESQEEDEYSVMDDTDDNSGIGLPSRGNAGRVWDLNEDTYITVTEPGQAYGYELDEDDEEDQDMASMRRGKQGGWSGGLASYPSTDLPEGSKEWIARRSYELMLKADAAELYRWTKRHLEPPAEIAALYSKHTPITSPLGKSAFSMSTPLSANEMMAVEHEDPDDDIAGEEEDDGMEALKRAIKFPCTYRFKVEGDVSEEFLPSVRETAEGVLNRSLADSAFTVEKEGRYQRVTIMVEVKNARQVTELYDALRNNPGVKFSYG